MDLNISKPLTLPCGLTLPNRLIKSALAESWADKDRLPSKGLIEAYGTWAEGGWGMVVTGNVMVDETHISTPEDVVLNRSLPREVALKRWKEWAASCNKNGTPTVVQINHPGRQSISWAGTNGLFGKTIAPSAIPLDLGPGLISRAATAALFGTPREMNQDDIDGVVAGFVETAQLVATAGFAGVQLHAAHGYLLAQFLSAKSNQRTDAYGGSPAKRAKIIVDIIHAMRDSLPKGFCIGIKFNSTDHQSPQELQDCIEQLQAITDAGVDFLEVSGGTYEAPTMLVESFKNKAASTSKREAFFLDFAKAIRNKFPGVPLVVTGGFRTRSGMEEAVREESCDLVGLGRPAIMAPSLPVSVVFNPEVKDKDAKLYVRRVASPWIARVLGLSSAIAGSAEVVWYQEELHKFIAQSGLTGISTTLGWVVSTVFRG
ncbi:hypothetical protein Golomagni_06274 [Golovinomyces magnicellulatus]|nr:hypothetical protein Golomagni_06274 [Golovinomyces magnicellulatus]